MVLKAVSPVSSEYPVSKADVAGAVSGPFAAFYCPNDYSPNESVGYLMRRIISLVGHTVERELEPTGLTNAQWVPLLKLQMGLASTVAELARECDLDAGSMTRLLDRLEAKGLVVRNRSVDDRRVVNLGLTDAGRVAAKEIPVALCGIQNQLLAGFSGDEWETLKDYLRRMLETAQHIQSSANGEASATATPAVATSQSSTPHAFTNRTGSHKNV